MDLNGIDEINAYRNKDGSYTIELHTFDKTYIVPYALLNIRLSTSLYTASDIELDFKGELNQTTNPMLIKEND